MELWSCCLDARDQLQHYRKKKYSVFKLYQNPPKCVFPSNLKRSNNLYLGKAISSLWPNLGRSTVHECQNNSNKTQRPGSRMENPILLGIISLSKNKVEQRQSFRMVHIKEARKRRVRKARPVHINLEFQVLSQDALVQNLLGNWVTLCQNKNK